MTAYVDYLKRANTYLSTNSLVSATASTKLTSQYSPVTKSAEHGQDPYQSGQAYFAATHNADGSVNVISQAALPGNAYMCDCPQWKGNATIRAFFRKRDQT